MGDKELVSKLLIKDRAPDTAGVVRGLNIDETGIQNANRHRAEKCPVEIHVAYPHPPFKQNSIFIGLAMLIAPIVIKEYGLNYRYPGIIILSVDYPALLHQYSHLCMVIAILDRFKRNYRDPISATSLDWHNADHLYYDRIRLNTAGYSSHAVKPGANP